MDSLHLGEFGPEDLFQTKLFREDYVASLVLMYQTQFKVDGGLTTDPAGKQVIPGEAFKPEQLDNFLNEASPGNDSKVVLSLIDAAVGFLNQELANHYSEESETLKNTILQATLETPKPTIGQNPNPTTIRDHITQHQLRYDGRLLRYTELRMGGYNASEGSRFESVVGLNHAQARNKVLDTMPSHTSLKVS
ncbi:hypothetical protein VCV18_012539 [Metarhizium anisopliae]